MITEAVPPETPDIDLDLSRGQIERRLEEEQAGLAAADARRADFERQLAFQQNRPTAISQRLSEAREQQEAIAAALQAELAGNLGLSMVRAQRWRLETRYAALSNEIKALDHELLSLPMRLELLAAKRDQEVAHAQRIGKRVEALKALVNAKRGLEAEKARAAAEQAVRATTGSDPDAGPPRAAECRAYRAADLGRHAARGAGCKAGPVGTAGRAHSRELTSASRPLRRSAA